jgi:hypothetical protein
MSFSIFKRGVSRVVALRYLIALPEVLLQTCQGAPRRTVKRMGIVHSGTISPEPPMSAGKSRNFGSPSCIGRTVSA